ncbi:hypothetical protein BH18VER1_BH18VER1_11410 [soil metagenome]
MFRLVCCAVAVSFVGNSFAADPTVQLLLPSRTLEPKSTFELRFATEMVSPDQIGKSAVPSPLVLQPVVPGQFVWLSTRSGTFAPEGVLPLGTEFQITLLPGVKDAAGRPVASKLKETAETPPFRIKGAYSIDSSSSDDASVRARHLVLFNANVDAAAVAKFCSFVDAAGDRIAAQVQPANDPSKHDHSFRRWESDDGTIIAWGEDPAPEAGDEGEDEADTADGTPAKPKPAPRNVVLVAPVKPLPPGKQWRLMIETGLPAAESNGKLATPRVVYIGTVKPFTVERIVPESSRNEGRRLAIEMTKPLAEDVTAESIITWMKVEPAPPKLRAEVEGSFVTWRGDFELGVPYRVTVAPGLPARDPVTFDKRYTNTVTFQKIAPRLYFQEFAVHQYAGGERQLRLVALNTPRVRMSARLFTGDAIPVALKAYGKYMDTGESEHDPDEFYARVDPASLPGEEIWTKDVAAGAELDKQEILSIGWDEIVGQNRTGVVLVTAESVDPVLPAGKRVGTQTFIQLTDLGAVWKKDREGTLLHVFSLSSGKGIAAAQVRLLHGEGSLQGEAVTDEQGNARLAEAEDSRWLAITSGNDTHVIAMNDSQNEMPLYRLGVTTQNYDIEGTWARSIYMFTERGVYKPADKVYLKGYARDLRDGEPRIPAGKKVKVKVVDPTEREIAVSEVTLSDYGSFDLEINLPNGSLGSYTARATGEEGDRLGGLCTFRCRSIDRTPLKFRSRRLRRAAGARSSICQSRRNISWANRCRRQSSPGHLWRAMNDSRLRDCRRLFSPMALMISV